LLAVVIDPTPSGLHRDEVHTQNAVRGRSMPRSVKRTSIDIQSLSTKRGESDESTVGAITPPNAPRRDRRARVRTHDRATTMQGYGAPPPQMHYAQYVSSRIFARSIARARGRERAHGRGHADGWGRARGIARTAWVRSRSRARGRRACAGVASLSRVMCWRHISRVCCAGVRGVDVVACARRRGNARARRVGCGWAIHEL